MGGCARAVEIKRLVYKTAGTEKAEYFGAEVEIRTICTITVNVPCVDVYYRLLGAAPIQRSVTPITFGRSE